MTLPADNRPPDLPAESATSLTLGPIERVTGYWPEMLADSVIHEVEVYFQESIPGDMADRIVGQMARRAEHLFQVHDRYRRGVSGANGRAWLLSFFRHWLAGELAKCRPTLFRRLPSSFKNGQPLPFSAPIAEEQ